MIDIIKEEIQKFLNENSIIENDNFRFRQRLSYTNHRGERVNNASFYKYEGFSNDYDVEIYESDIYVNWHVGFEVNDSGINDFVPYIDSVDGTYHIEYRDKQTDEVAQEADKDIAEIKWNFNFYNTPVLKGGSSLYIKSADFDFSRRECEITFYETED